MKSKLTATRMLLCVLSLGGFLATPIVVNAEEEAIEEVVVTGSYIRGTPEDAELPVDVLTREDFEDIGNPSVIDLVRNLGVTSGNLGETNQFQAGGQANEGVATINLRGLGGARTLVLINGRRHVPTETQGVDINAIPSLAIGRLEILKDGAAATYGSDAIGGVVNFITRENFEGFEIGGSFMDIEDSDGDWDVGGIFGLAGERFNWMVSAEYSERGELPINSRDWALRPFSEQPQGGWSGISNPGNILVPGVGVVADPQCELLGTQRSPGNCGFQYTGFDNLTEETKAIKVFSQFRYDLTDNIEFNAEVLYSEVDIEAWKTSPSYPPQSLFGADRVVLPDHPGLVDFRAQNPAFPQTGIVIPITRARGAVGKGPGGEPEDGERYTETMRVAMGLDGTLFDDQLSFNINASYSKRDRRLTGNDMYIQRMAFALKGYGGADCDRDAAVANATPGQNGCEYYNPFSNAIQRSVVNGAVNPQYNPAVGNSEELYNWLIADTQSDTENELFVLEAIFSGETGIELGGGNVGWAMGAQTRRERYSIDYPDVVNRAINPCAWNDPLAITLGFTADLDCEVQSGQLAFLAAADPESTSRRVYGVFGELALPITDTINVQAAVRFEDYGGSVGSTIDPKVAVSWNATDELTFRGSMSTTFRGPPQSFLSGTNTALQFIPAQNAFKAVDIVGNPDLEPESAVTMNFGVIYQNEVFYASLDYWSFDFEDAFQTESAQQIVNGYLAQGCNDGAAGVGTASCAAFRSHIFPLGTDAAGLQRVETNVINGEDIQTSGLDLFAQYDFNEVAGGTLSFGLEGTYVLEYESDDFVDINGALLAPGGDFVGFLNDGDPFTPKPEFKGSVFVKYSNGNHRAQLIARYVDGYEDVRPSLPSLANIDDQTTIDLHYNVDLFEAAVVSLSVVNLTDEDPPLTSTDLNYDAFTHNPFGRTIKLGVKYTFGANN